MYRVMFKYKIYPFKLYSEALEFKNKNGGTIYQKVSSSKFTKKTLKYEN